MENAPRARLNLSDAVDDLAPLQPPPCFHNRSLWIQYLRSAASAQNQRGEPKVILIHDGVATFNWDFPFCADCTQIKSLDMMRKERCQPEYLRRLGSEINGNEGSD
jgi:hypothetical protein